MTPSPFHDNEEAVEEIALPMEESPSRNRQGQLKQLCLKRDNFRCLATGVVDRDVEGSAQGPSGPTELAHILPLGKQRPEPCRGTGMCDLEKVLPRNYARSHRHKRSYKFDDIIFSRTHRLWRTLPGF
ncbi:hypothetical protein VTN77DRAFT_5359 [Rasamsonia byssochlamydoides]|uniref:uncharacterized protein n=1 Tax=Rasamsonia byssochlamydoides TaxID=89139 RepID=UPI0037449732